MKTYYINSWWNPTPELDIDEFECICQQFAAMELGYADYVEPLVRDEEYGIIYEWERGHDAND